MISMCKGGAVVRHQEGFIILDGMIIMGCCLLWLTAGVIFHLQYVQHMQRAMDKLDMIEHAQEIVGHVRTHTPHRVSDNSVYRIVVEEQQHEQLSLKWVRTTLQRDEGTHFSLCTVCA